MEAVFHRGLFPISTLATFISKNRHKKAAEVSYPNDLIAYPLYDYSNDKSNWPLLYSAKTVQLLGFKTKASLIASSTVIAALPLPVITDGSLSRYT